MRQITVPELECAAAVLADAFVDDPLHLWIYPSRNYDERRFRSWRSFIELVGLPRGLVQATDDLEGVAIWMPPQATSIGWRERARLATRYIRVLGPRLPRGARAFSAIDAARPSQPHWYLEAIGVRGDAQRRGHGSSLLEPMLERAEREGVAVHLETFKAENVPYYERFGFRVTGRTEVRNGPWMWTMLRRAR